MPEKIVTVTDLQVNIEVVCECRDCNAPMDLIQQQKWNGGVLILATCKNPNCLLQHVTLTIPEYVNKSDSQLEEYREVNRRNRFACQTVEVGK